VTIVGCHRGVDDPSAHDHDLRHVPLLVAVAGSSASFITAARWPTMIPPSVEFHLAA
jgi:hypothetical protein